MKRSGSPNSSREQYCFAISAEIESVASETQLKSEIELTVVQRLGAFARPAAIYIVRALPKTRSGKILRRAILAIAEDRDSGDLSTLEDPAALEAIEQQIGADRG
jgi:propionyl-CoA synthetase